MIKTIYFFLLIAAASFCEAQSSVNLKAFNNKGSVKVTLHDSTCAVTWPVEKNGFGKIILDLSKDHPLFKSIQLNNKGIATGLDPAFILTIGKRDLVSQNGWNIFFDKV
ncbi:MAG: hypothetical protein ABIN25_14685, partial [Ginsengibacter sp.]